MPGAKEIVLPVDRRNSPSSPIVAVGRGGSGTRLLSLLLQRLGVFVGNRVNEYGDATEWVELIYRMVVAIVPHRPDRMPDEWRGALRACAQEILSAGQWRAGTCWGWKLPETLLVLPEVLEAFPEAKVVHLVRHPVDSCLRRTHLTSRADNSIGRATLEAAYESLGWPRDPASDEDHIRNAASWRFQLETVRQIRHELPSERYLEIRYEDLCLDTNTVSNMVARFVGVCAPPPPLPVDRARMRSWKNGDPRTVEVWKICGSEAEHFGYSAPSRSNKAN